MSRGNHFSSVPLVLLTVLALAGCEGVDFGPVSDLFGRAADSAETAEPDSAGEATEATSPEIDADAPSATAAAPGNGSGLLGTTIASLGDPNRPGLWVRTPLVSAPVQGRVRYAVGDRSAQVELIPSGGVEGSGSQISLAAMRLLQAPLGRLLELDVYRE